MTERQPDAKTLKKSLKAQIKQAKKEAKATQAASASSVLPVSAKQESASGITPAERSAAAAEKQVRLQRWRVILALAGVAIGIATILLTMRPWERNANADNQPNLNATAASPAP